MKAEQGIRARLTWVGYWSCLLVRLIRVDVAHVARRIAMEARNLATHEAMIGGVRGRWTAGESRSGVVYPR